jgi:hypothetical protein
LIQGLQVSRKETQHICKRDLATVSKET